MCCMMPQNKAACCSLFLAFAGELGVKSCTTPMVSPNPSQTSRNYSTRFEPNHPFQTLFSPDRAGLCRLDQAVYSFPREATPEQDGNKRSTRVTHPSSHKGPRRSFNPKSSAQRPVILVS